MRKRSFTSRRDTDQMLAELAALLTRVGADLTEDERVLIGKIQTALRAYNGRFS